MTATVRGRWIAEKPARTIGIAIVLLGIELGIVQFSHGFRATDPIVFGIGVVIPFSLSLALGGAGIWIWRGDLSEIQAVRMGIWIVCGAVWMSIVGIGAIMYQTFCGATIHNPLFFLSVFVTY